MNRTARIALGSLAATASAAIGAALFTAAVARRAERMVPRDGCMVEVDEARLHVADLGRGPALLLIHGLAGQMRNFAPLVDRLAANHRVVLVDRPGSGYSRAAPGPQPSLAAQARLVARLIARLGLGRPIVVGHSFGGALALALALDHPDQVGGLALVAPLTRPEKQAPKPFRALAIRSPRLRALVAWTAATPLTLLGGARLLEPIFAPEPVPPGFAVRGGGALGLRPGNFEAASADLVGIPDAVWAMVPRYGDMRVPVEILFGAGDRILAPGRQGAPFPGARYEVVAGGHMIPYTRPAVTAAWIAAAAARCRATMSSA